METYKGKTIEIRRHFNMLALAQNDPEVKAWYGQAYRAIGPYFANKTAGSGLSFEEQRLLLPEIIGIEPTDRNFRTAVMNFYHEFLTKVPEHGIKLQISLQNDSLPLSESNMPINVKDYLTYRHAINHPEVASSIAEAEKNFRCRFYIVDPDGVTKGALKVNDLEDKATVTYMKYKDDAIKLDQILVMLGVDIRNMKPEDKLLKLKEFSRRDERLNEPEQVAAFTRFIDTAEDKHLEYKYLIQEMIGAQYLKRVGNTIVYNESGETIAQDLEGAVAYFKNPKNSRELNMLKSQYVTKVKKSSEYLPKDTTPKPMVAVDEQKTE